MVALSIVGCDAPDDADEEEGVVSQNVVTSLTGSEFEIDTDANLKRDDPSPNIDWASVTEARKADVLSGKDDNSYSGGAKEDDACPGTTTGSIPPEKSDLLNFGAYVEPETGGPGFLHLFWQRVQEPNGTTLMDFELNQSSTLCANGVNPVRTAGDLLLEYRIEQGGAAATIKVRTWSGTAWGAAVDLTGSLAIGTINSSAIPGGDADGLVPSTSSVSPRTFGEASLDLDFVFDENKCTSFGSAFVKSRSSDSFTSQLKDFIAPVPVNISNCGQVKIRKVTVPATDTTSTFGFTKSFGTDPSTTNTFTLQNGGLKAYNNVLFGTGYTVVEDVVPTGWQNTQVNCSASTGVTPTITPALTGSTVTFAIDNAADILDCTYTNTLQTGAIKIVKTRKHAADGPGDHAHAGVQFTVSGGSLSSSQVVTTNASGEACIDGLVISALAGNYTVVETVPSGYVADAPGDTRTGVVVTTGSCLDPDVVNFSNTPLTNLTCSVDSQIDGGTASTITCTPNGGDPVTTGANGDGSKTLSNLVPGTYTCTVVIDP